jgi:hypothetical protein
MLKLTNVSITKTKCSSKFGCSNSKSAAWNKFDASKEFIRVLSYYVVSGKYRPWDKPIPRTRSLRINIVICRSKSPDHESFKMTVKLMAFDFFCALLLLIKLPSSQIDKLYA